MDINFELIRLEMKDVVREALLKKSALLIENKQKTFNRTESDLKAPLDQGFRDILLELIEQEVEVKILEDLITLSIECCRKGLSSLSMPVILLADIFDLLTLDFCEKMFAYVEKHVNIWKEDLFFTSCKNNLLRMCNDLLRRLSRSSATIFCGRILLFLAKFFPFSERSGLNIVSEFNLENVTEYGSENIDDIPKDKEKDDKNKGIYIDYSLYCKFWSLQDFFRNPNQCYNKVQWKLFCSHASSIIGTFQGLKLEHIDKQATWALTDETDASEEKTPYFSKYLTNQKLLDLQLYDVNFRRFVLLQFMILFQYLTTTVRFKTETYELKTDQKDWIQNITEKIYSLLKETPPDGEKFAKIVNKILNREEYWNSWKNDGCPEFRKVLPIATEVSEKKKSDSKDQFLGDVIKNARKFGTFHMGNQELTKLWNLYPDNLEACKTKERDFLPSLDSYFGEAIEQLDNLEPGQDNLLKDGNFGWRALRLLARRSPHFFTHSNKPISELHSYLEMMVRRIAADKPGTAHEATEQNDAEIEEDLFKQPDDMKNADGDTGEDMKNNDGDDVDENYYRFKVTLLTITQFDTLCEKLENIWKVLAPKLGYKSDEIDYIESQHQSSKVEQARSLLHLWFEEDDDSTLENFLYILEGLQMDDVAETVRLAIEQNKNLNIS